MFRRCVRDAYGTHFHPCPHTTHVQRGIECDVRSVDAAAGASLFPIGAGKYSPADLFANDAYGEYSLMYAITEVSSCTRSAVQYHGVARGRGLEDRGIAWGVAPAGLARACPRPRAGALACTAARTPCPS